MSCFSSPSLSLPCPFFFFPCFFLILLTRLYLFMCWHFTVKCLKVYNFTTIYNFCEVIQKWHFKEIFWQGACTHKNWSHKSCISTQHYTNMKKKCERHWPNQASFRIYHSFFWLPSYQLPPRDQKSWKVGGVANKSRSHWLVALTTFRTH